MVVPVVSLLPNAQQQFADANGAAYAGGSVWFYVPNTATPKDTWTDSTGATLNTNPVVLDAAGRPTTGGGAACGIWGSGAYRQVLIDRDGNTIWDLETLDWSANLPAIPKFPVISGTVSGADAITFTAIDSGQSPTIYDDYQIYLFQASGTSTATVTFGLTALGLLPVYFPDRTTQAGAEAFLAGNLYGLAYDSSLGTIGGFQLVTLPPNWLQLEGHPAIPLATSPGTGLLSMNSAIILATGASTTLWENGLSVQMQATAGHGTALAVKVAGYFSTEVTGAAGGDSWSLNTVLVLDSGAVPNAAHQGIEIDVANNTGTDFGDTLGTFAAPAVLGLSIGSIGSNRISAAISVNGLITGGSSPVYNRGIVFANTSVRLATIQDFTFSTTFADVRGAHTYGLDGNNSTISGGLVRLGNTQQIVARNAANTADLTVLQVGVGNALYFGYPLGVTGVFSNASMFPATDNTYSFGTSGFRWTEIWAANGTIQTSDPRLKTEIAALPAALPLVMSIEPKTWKWISGGQSWTEVDEEQEVQAETEITEHYTEVEIVSGKPTLVDKVRTHRELKWDYQPVWNADGSPAMEVIEARDPQFDRRGRLVVPGRAASTFQRTHPVPVMERRVVKVPRVAERPGRRTHWGFMAPEVKAAFGERDFGGYVKAPDGTEALRSDQLLAVLWAAVRELAAEVAELRTQLAAK